ncbi:MAG: sodium:solute symporter family protein [Bacillota bacterium]
MSGSLLAIILFGVVVVIIGVYGARFSRKTAVDYMLAGRQIGSVVMFFYVAFVIYSAWTFYGYPGFTYLSGAPYSIFVMTAHLSFAAFFVLVGPRLWAVSRLHNLISPIEFIGRRYESPFLQQLTAIVLLVFIVPYVGVQVVGAGAGFHALTGLPYMVGATYLGVLLVSVVLLGGMRTVAWVNVFLGSLFIAGFAGSLIWVIAVALPNGLVGAAQQLQATNPSIFSAPGPMGIWTYKAMIGLSVTGLTACAWPHVVVTTMTARTVGVLRSFALSFIVLGGIIFYAIPNLWGMLVGPALMPGLKGKAADAVVQMVITQFLPTWFGVLVLMAVVAAALSTVGTQLMVSGIFISRDLLTRWIGRKISDAEMITYTRIGLFVVIVLSFIMAWKRPTEMGLYLSAIASPGFSQWLPLLVGGLFWKRGTKQGAVAGLAGGVLVLVLAMKYKAVTLGFQPVLVAFVVNVILYVTVSLCTRPVDKSTLAMFFEQLDDYLAGKKETESK